MASLRDLIPEVRTHLDGAPDETCLLYLGRAAKQFCADSGVWVHDLGEGTVSPADDPNDYVYVAVPDSDNDDSPWEMPKGAYMHSVQKIMLGGRVLDRITGTQEPVYMYDVVTGQLRMASRVITQDGETLKVYAMLTPAKTASVLPEFLVERHAEGIASYAISQMLMMPNREWSDPRLASNFMVQYSQRVSESRVSVARGGTRGKIALKPIPF